MAAECSAIAAVALRSLGRVNEEAGGGVEAEEGFRALGAVALLDRLAREWSEAASSP